MAATNARAGLPGNSLWAAARSHDAAGPRPRTLRRAAARRRAKRRAATPSPAVVLDQTTRQAVTTLARASNTVRALTPDHYAQTDPEHSPGDLQPAQPSHSPSLYRPAHGGDPMPDTDRNSPATETP